MKPLFRVKIVDSIPELEELRGYWTAWQSHPLSDLDLYLNTIATTAFRPYTMVLFSDEKPIALLPGTLEEQKMPFRIGWLKWSGPSIRVLSFAYGGILGDQCPESVDLILNEVMRRLSKHEADLAILHNVRKNSLLYELALGLPRLLSRDPWPMDVVHYTMELPQTSEAMYQRLSHDHRKRLRQTAKKLMSQYAGAISVRRFSADSDVSRLIDQIEQVACKTYQRAFGVGFSPTPHMTARLHLAAQRKWLRAYIMEVATEPRAFVLGTLYQGIFHLDYVGYDVAMAKYSPGTFLLTHAIEELCRENVTTLDFGFGSEMYKERFGTDQFTEGRIHIFSNTAKGLMLNAMRLCTLLLGHAATEMLQRTRLFDKVKTAWRSRLRKRQLALAGLNDK